MDQKHESNNKSTSKRSKLEIQGDLIVLNLDSGMDLNGENNNNKNHHQIER